MKNVSPLLISFISIIIACNVAVAQVSSGTIEGSVHESGSQKQVSYATIMLLKSTDSSVVKGTITDTTGKYVIEDVPEGNYMLAVTYLATLKKYSEKFHLAKGEKVKLKPLLLESSAESLKEVSVTAQKPLFEQKPGMMVVNVEGSVTDIGNSAMDILKKSPGVNVDDNDNISIKGKNGVTVMIDDKPTYLSSTDLAIMLKNIPASSISQIEVMTNPPAKYDAEGTAGIINIRLKKNTSFGFNGSFTALYKQARYPYYNPSIILNYKTKKMNLFGSYNYSNYKSYDDAHLTRKYSNADTLNTIFAQHRVSNFSGDNHVFKTGLDYFINSCNTLGLIVTGLFNNDNRDVNNLTNIENNINVLQSTEVSDIRYTNKFYSTSYNLNYKSVLDTSGTKLTLNADYANYSNSGNMNFNTGYFDPEGSTISLPTIWAGNQAALINIESFKADFEHPMKHNIKLEAGVKTSMVSSDNNLFFQDYINNQWVTDNGITNHFKYGENINAAYISLSKAFKGFTLQAGLRGEQTIANGKQLTNDSSFNKNYFQLFPTLFIDRPINKDNEISFSYSRRLDRPDYQDLNPFRYYVDPLTYRVGNTRLAPQLTNAIEITDVYKSTFSTTLDVSQVTGVMTEVINQVDSNKATIQYKDNFNELNNVTLSFGLPFKLTKWWQSSNQVMGYFDQYKGQYLGTPLNRSEFNFEFHSQNEFILSPDIIFELSGFYRSGGIYTSFNELASYSVSAGLRKSFWHKRANIKFNVDDIFYTEHFKGYLHYQNIDIDILHQWESRTLSIAFTYNFGNTNVHQTSHKNGIEEEQQRVKKSTG